jgi:hypothetical protein
MLGNSFRGFVFKLLGASLLSVASNTLHLFDRLGFRGTGAFTIFAPDW